MTEFFDVKNFSIRPVLVFAIILLLFGCYVTQIHYLCDHQRVDRALRLMFSHYFVVIALNRSQWFLSFWRIRKQSVCLRQD